MKEVSELRAILGQYLLWNKARLDCFAQMLLALFITRTVNLSEMAVAMISPSEVASRYKRLQRFFRLPTRVLLFQYSGACLIRLAMQLPLNTVRSLLVLFVSLGNPAFLVFSVIENSQVKNAIPFYIRIKEGSLLKVKGKKWLKASKLFSHLNLREKSEFQMTVWIYGQKVYLAGSRSERGELMIVATNRNPKNAIAIYLRRWEIECLFACLKGRGFRFEQTHLVDRARIKKMLALLAIGFCWAHKTGEWRASIKPIRWCKRRGSTRPQSSYLRYGLDFIREAIINPFKKIREFRRILAFFEPEQNAAARVVP